jgi:hypothetical protein
MPLVMKIKLLWLVSNKMGNHKEPILPIFAYLYSRALFIAFVQKKAKPYKISNSWLPSPKFSKIIRLPEKTKWRL